jgi:hypothetical protein
VLGSDWDPGGGATGGRTTRRGADRDAKVALSRITAAKNSGYAWMAENFTMRGNPHHAYPMYFLYGVERACELGEVALLNGRDWYHEGAMLLMGTQLTNGGLGPTELHETCFGVLFLRLAAPPIPVLTNRKK